VLAGSLALSASHAADVGMIFFARGSRLGNFSIELASEADDDGRISVYASAIAPGGSWTPAEAVATRVCWITHSDGRAGVGILTPVDDGEPPPSPGLQVSIRLPRALFLAREKKPNLEADLRGFAQSISLPSAELDSVTLNGNGDIRLEGINAERTDITSSMGGIFGSLTVSHSAKLMALGGPIDLVQLGMHATAGAESPTRAELSLTPGGCASLHWWDIDSPRPGLYIRAAAQLLATGGAGSGDNPSGSDSSRFDISMKSLGRPADLRVAHAPAPGAARAFGLVVENTDGPLNVTMYPAFAGVFSVDARGHRAAVVDGHGAAGRSLVLHEARPAKVGGWTWVGEKRVEALSYIYVYAGGNATLVV